MKEVLEICNEFLKIPSVVGYEKPFLDYLEEQIKQLGYPIKRDDKYLVVNPNSENSRYLFSTHIDRQGFVKNNNDEIVYATNHIKQRDSLPFKREEIKPQEEALFDMLKNSLNCEVKVTDDFLIFTSQEFGTVKFFRQDDSGSLEKVALRYVNENIVEYDYNSGKLGNKGILQRYDMNYKQRQIKYDCDNEFSYGVFALISEITQKKGYFYGQLDNVISAAVLFYLLKQGNFNDEIIFTTGEEIGISYNCVLEYLNGRVDLNVIVMDTSPYQGFYQGFGIQSSDESEVGFLTLRYGDERNGFDKELVESVKKLLESSDIKYDLKPSFMGRTELGLLAKNTNGALKGTTIQIPTLNYHTTYETATLKSLENYVTIIKLLVNS